MPIYPGNSTTVSNGQTTLTTNSATALVVGANGATNPAFTVNASAASSDTGWAVASIQSTGTGPSFTVTSSQAAENGRIDAKGTGTLTLQGTATGIVNINHGLTVVGGTTNINASSNNNTNINTGSSTGTIGIGNAAAGALTIASGAASTIRTTSANLTVGTLTSGTLNLSSAGAFALSGVSASTITATSSNLTISTATSGTLAVTSAGALNLTSVAGSTWAHSGGALAITSTSQNLTISTATSGTLAITSAGALNLTSVTTSSWQQTGGTLTINATSQALTLSTTTSGTLSVTSAGALNLTGAAASTWAQVANTAAAMSLTDGTNGYYVVDTRTATDNVNANLFGVTGPSYASASGSTFSNVAAKAFTINFTGGTGVTAATGLQFKANTPTITAGQATTVTTASVAYFNGPVASTNTTITTGINVHVDNPAASGGTFSNSVGIKVEALSRGSANIALWVQNPIQIGNSTVNTTNNQLHTATQGAGSTQMFIGNSSINVTSDMRVKQAIEPTQRDAMAIVKALPIVEYEWTKDAGRDQWNTRGKFTGILAQDLIKVAPWVVNGEGRDCPTCLAGGKCDAHGPLMVEYDHLVPTLIRALQQMDGEIKSLRSKLPIN